MPTGESAPVSKVGRAEKESQENAARRRYEGNRAFPEWNRCQSLVIHHRGTEDTEEEGQKGNRGLTQIARIELRSAKCPAPTKKGQNGAPQVRFSVAGPSAARAEALAAICRPCRDSRSIKRAYPALKRWAEICRTARRAAERDCIVGSSFHRRHPERILARLSPINSHDGTTMQVTG